MSVNNRHSQERRCISGTCGLSRVHVQPPTFPPFVVSRARQVHLVSSGRDPDLTRTEFAGRRSSAGVEGRRQRVLLDPRVGDEEP